MTMPPLVNPKKLQRDLYRNLGSLIGQLASWQDELDQAIKLAVYNNEDRKLDGHRLHEEIEANLTRVLVHHLKRMHPEQMEGITVDDEGFIDRADLHEHHERIEAILTGHILRDAGRLS
ncbi:hypothetical protein [Ruegeria sp. HKCCE3926]|uniref:hypothetical protein n=1 Tax=Ruegeria sp. HKCCE3926 TaxID=2794831 RepID=UPI001AE8D7DD|nr:hypothetical protein [Ruegeria sp. HKCCE3926]